MLILSWNVAGLSTTVNRIHSSYDSPAPKGTKRQPTSAALARFLELHGADIACLQEHKIPKQQLSSKSEPRHCSNVTGYESFWSCCVDNNKKGLNGVVTYAKQGSVLRADAAPLGSPDLDAQGRCVMTDHGTFVLFNVYVPASGGQPLAFKMKFLNALRRSMRKQRQEKQKPVVLVGDLNIAHTEKDIFWKDRVVHVDEVLDVVAESGCDLPRWKVELAEHWPKIEQVLESKEVVPTQTSNSMTGEKYDKFRLAVAVDGRRVYLGGHEVSAEYCTHRYDFSPYSYRDPETNEELPAQEANAVGVGVLAELMSKIVGVQWDEPILRSIVATDGSVRRLSPTRKWLSTVLQDDDMVDVFRYHFPSAEARFTCWNQSLNRRYFNDGSRIDYTIVDRCLMNRVADSESGSLRCGGAAMWGKQVFTEEAALSAATANGRFQPVSFEGGGINEAAQDTLDTQFGPAHTGMVYTPPSFSDHIGVSLSMCDSLLCKDLVVDEFDAATRKAQPHKLQKTIASFFAAGARSGPRIPERDSIDALSGNLQRKGIFARSLSSSSSSSKRAKLSVNKNAAKSSKSILIHFQKKA